MKKLFLMLIFGFVFIGCNVDRSNSELEKSKKSEKTDNVENQGFKFDKSNNYSKGKKNNYSKGKEEEKKSADSHKGCTAPCCSEDK